MRLAQLDQRLQAIHFGHLDVHEDQVGVDLGKLGQGNAAVGCGAGHLQQRIAGEHVRQEPANDHRVVDNQDANFAHGLCALLPGFHPAAPSFPFTRFEGEGMSISSLSKRRRREKDITKE